MKANEIRTAFLEFFEKKGHRVVPSSPLIPKDDPTLLFTNAGMNQFKNIFLGLEKRSYSRAATVQKCLRVSGKHNDLEQVGRTPKHHTFFEMLGNFSFGDYFKREAIAFAWELVTEVYRLPAERLYITVYQDDDEAFRLWNREIGIPAEKIFRFGKEDNFWAMGETGPCGPCSEIHYDLGEDIDSGLPRDLIASGSYRFVELWNLVFMEFFQDERGQMHPLPRPSIDTGMGLERMAAVLQGRRSNFETDLFSPLIQAIVQETGQEYPTGGETDVWVRIIADHIRAITFLIGDGVTPANEGRGYVLRRLIRRAFRRGNLLGLDKPFLYRLAGTVVDIMKEAYPELMSNLPYISRVCLAEEERFIYTLNSGLRYFEQYAEETLASGGRVIPGDRVFKLYDTFGFPLDLCQELAREKNLEVDEAGFQKELEIQKDRARQSWEGEARFREKSVYQNYQHLKIEPVFYDRVEVAETEVLAIIKNGLAVDSLKEGESGEVILSVTPFYAEAGGQVGDSGILKSSHFSGVVENTFAPIPGLIVHLVKVLAGQLKTGQVVEAVVDATRRKAISRNHTATHLLHAALRQILGDHVRQSGSLVSHQRFRFDFTHFAALSEEEIEKVERLVNEKIRENLPVMVKVTTLEEGLAEGAMAIFEEKYGEKVRLVTVGDFSKELCGGIHVRQSGEIGFFKIISESSVAAGLRRIEAVTGEEAFNYVEALEKQLRQLERLLKVSRKELLARAEKILDTLEEREEEIKKLKQKLVQQAGQSPEMAVREVKGIKLVTQKFEGIDIEALRQYADSLKQKIGSGVVVLTSAVDGRVFLVVAVTADLTPKVQANKLIKDIAGIIGGGGGGRPDFAQAGGTRPENIDRALEKSVDLLEKVL
ncbi:MAG: alanine--tRNA ligase [Candidatus Saccharicenans sp.]|nr:alanine--tRNA ligase [Candidatus Saccharicenans sp.]MDH7574173.1 alanine--tRNA ligase [Candidatus Saccharicenans sp.]